MLADTNLIIISHWALDAKGTVGQGTVAYMVDPG